MGDSDFKKKDDGIDAFQKDKRRRRTVTVEAVTRSPRATSERPAYQPREDHDDRNHDSERPQRRSYNPNFSSDNKFIGGPRREHAEQPEREFNRWDGGQQERRQRDDFSPAGERKPYSDRPYERKPYGGERSDRPYEKKSYGERPYGERKPYGDKPYGEKKQYGDKPYGDRKPYGDKKPFGARKPFVKKTPEGVMDPGMKPEFYPSYNMPNTGKEIRLNRYIAMSGKCSRREADEFITRGEVMVNGQVVSELGVKVKPGDEIRLKGELLSNEKKVYIIMNKPKGYVTSVDDPHAEKTVMDIVKNACDERIYPVGRLDKSSVGVLLLTNDGDLTEKLTHPSHNKRKVYQVTLERPLTNFDLQRARDGIDLDDGVIIPDAVDFVKPENRKEVGIEIHSGRNRIVRRIFEELGYGVHKLDRVYFAGLTKKNLKRGQWRFLTDREVSMLKSGRYE